jgi:hypothetical protein
MPKTVSVIGIEESELRWIRTLIVLLRHPDPSIPELARQALTYLTASAGERALRYGAIEQVAPPVLAGSASHAAREIPPAAGEDRRR